MKYTSLSFITTFDVVSVGDAERESVQSRLTVVGQLVRWIRRIYMWLGLVTSLCACATGAWNNVTIMKFYRSSSPSTRNFTPFHASAFIRPKGAARHVGGKQTGVAIAMFVCLCRDGCNYCKLCAICSLPHTPLPDLDEIYFVIVYFNDRCVVRHKIAL